MNEKEIEVFGGLDKIHYLCLYERNTRHQWPLYRGSGNNSFCQTKCSSECGLLPSTNVLADRSPYFGRRAKRKERADYGAYLLKNLAKKLEPEFGSGFSVRQLEMCRQFYRVYPIANTVCSQLNWSQYKLLISIPDEYKREYYQLEAVNNCWTKRELERQINSQLYERLLLSNDNLPSQEQLMKEVEAIRRLTESAD